MTHLLPPNLLRLFAPRPPLAFAKPLGRDPDKPIGADRQKITGVAGLLETIRQESAEHPETWEEKSTPTDTEYQKFLNRDEARKKRREELNKADENWDPKTNPNAEGDPYKTLFISRLSKEATEEDLRREFAMYGHIDKLVIVRHPKTGKSKGYAFILYEREKDMKAAYKDAEGIKILGKRILVDVERGRTVKGWKPQRMGGGLGGRKKPEPEPAFTSFRGGRGGFRGGFRGGDRGGFRGGGRGGGGDRGFQAPFQDGGYSRGGYSGGRPGGGGGAFGDSGRGSYGGPPRGGGIGYQGGGFSSGPRPNAFGMPPGPGGPPGGGYGAPPPPPPTDGGYSAYGQKRSYDDRGSYGGSDRGSYSRDSRSGGGGYPSRSYADRDRGHYDDRDSKRPRY